MKPIKPVEAKQGQRNLLKQSQRNPLKQSQRKTKASLKLRNLSKDQKKNAIKGKTKKKNIIKSQLKGEKPEHNQKNAMEG